MLNYEKDGKKFAELMQFLAIKFNNQKAWDIEKRKLTKEELRMYFFYLQDEFEDINQFAEVVKHIGKKQSYGRMPDPADFIQVKKELFELTDKELEVLAREAYNTAFDAVFLVGSNTPDFEDKLINATINKIGGWIKFHDYSAYSNTHEDLKRREDMRKQFEYWYKLLFAIQKVTDVKLVGRKSVIKKVECGYLEDIKKAKKSLKAIENKSKKENEISEKTRQMLNIKRI